MNNYVSSSSGQKSTYISRKEFSNNDIGQDVIIQMGSVTRCCELSKHNVPHVRYPPLSNRC